MYDVISIDIDVRIPFAAPGLDHLTRARQSVIVSAASEAGFSFEYAVSSFSNLALMKDLKNLASWGFTGPLVGGLGPILAMFVAFVPTADPMMGFLQAEFSVSPEARACCNSYSPQAQHFRLHLKCNDCFKCMCSLTIVLKA